MDGVFKFYFCSIFFSLKENEFLFIILNFLIKFWEKINLVDVRDIVGFGEGFGFLGR